MKSNKEIMQRVFDWAGSQVNWAREKIRFIKISLPRLSATLVRTTTNKTKVLKEKYKGSRLRTKTSIEVPKEVNTWLTLPKFSLSQLPKFDNYLKWLGFKQLAAAAVALSLLLGVLIVNSYSQVNAFAMQIEGKTIAVVSDKAEAERVLNELKAEKARVWNRKVDSLQKVSYVPVKVKRIDLEDSAEVKGKLSSSITLMSVATAIKIEGQTAVIVKDADEAEKVLQEIKKSYENTDIKVQNIGFQEKVEIEDVPASLSDVLPLEKAVQIMMEGRAKKTVHIVKQGDSLWSIARSNDMRVADLQKANPDIKGERLDLGQEVNLVALEPMLNVVVSGQRTVKENVPYKVVVETDKSLYRGREKVKVRGENGQREVTYKIVMKNGSIVSKDVMDQKVLKQPVNQVVTRGSKMVVASRSGGGKVGWPLRGSITSRYGKRWGGRHTGIDIDGYKGQPVGAAMAGVVVSTGWEGGYGKMVTIRHDNGIVTRYAHLSKIEVSRGQKVERGDLIGLVGSTGNSTGSHLHFEVLNGGSFQNPIKYLR